MRGGFFQFLVCAPRRGQWASDIMGVCLRLDELNRLRVRGRSGYTAIFATAGECNSGVLRLGV